MRLHLLGKLRVSTGGSWLEPRPNKPLCLLSYAAYHEGWVGREDLSFLFWPDTSERSAQQNLRRLIHRAKEFEFTKGFEVETTRLRWSVDTDIKAFKQAVAEQNWAETIALYAGSFLEEVELADSPGYTAWLVQERSRLTENWHKALSGVSEQLEQHGDHKEAAKYLLTLLSADGLNETFLQRYLRNAYLAGEHEVALEVFGTYRQKLDREPLETTLNLVDTLKSTAPIRLPGQETLKPTVPPKMLRPPELIGRENDILRLQQAPTPVTLISGEAGVGKSRLMVEAVPHAPLLRCQEGLSNVSYYPVIAFIRTLGEQGVTTPDLGFYADDLARLVPDALPHLSPGPADPDTGRARLFEALSRYVEGATRQLLMDDLQWADEATLAWLVYLAHRKTIKLLGTYRIHEVTPALQKSLSSLKASRLLTEVPLNPLSEEMLSQLMAELLGTDDVPQRFSRWLTTSTGGNPMFALETLKSFFEAGTFQLGETGWRSTLSEEAYDELEPPKAVADVIQRRLGRLSESTERVLKTAAVVGDGFTPSLLSQVSGLPNLTVLEALEEAEARGLVQGTTFSHDLVRQSIYKDLSPTRCKRLHAQVATHQTSEPARLAEHWLLAGEPDKAISAWQDASRELARQGLLEEALELLKRAEVHSEATQLEHLRLDMATIYFQQARYSDASQVTADLVTAQDTFTRALALNLKAKLLLKEGQIERAHSTVHEGLDLSILEDETRLQLRLTQHITTFERGQHQASIDLLASELPSLRSKGPSLELAQVLTNIATVHNHLGDYEKALTLHLEALDIARQLGARHVQVDVAQNLVYCYIELGRSEESLSVGEEALGLGQYEMTDSLRANLAAAYIKLKRYAEAISHYEALTESDETTVRLVAWGRLAGLYSWTEQADAATHAVAKALNLLDATQIEIARARVIISALCYGNTRQRAQATCFIEEVSAYSLPPYLREEFDDALELRSTRTDSKNAP